jgi:hypothetical protein
MNLSNQLVGLEMIKNKNNIYRRILKGIVLGIFLAGKIPNMIVSVHGAAPWPMQISQKMPPKEMSPEEATEGLFNLMIRSLYGEKLLSFSETVQFFVHNGADTGRVAALLCENGFSREAVEQKMQCARAFLLDSKFYIELVERAMQCDSAEKAQIEEKVRTILAEVGNMYADDEEVDTISKILADKFPNYEGVIELAVEDVRCRLISPDPPPEQESLEAQLLKRLLNIIAGRDPRSMQAIIESLREAFRDRYDCEEVIDFAVKYVERRFVTPYTPPDQELAAKALLRSIGEHPEAIQAIIDSIRVIFMNKFPDCEAVTDLAIGYVWYKFKVLSMPPNQKEQKLPLAAQTVKALWHIMYSMDPMTMQTMTDPLKKIFMTRFPFHEKFIDFMIGYMLNTSSMGNSLLWEAIIDLVVEHTSNAPLEREFFPEMKESKVLWNVLCGIIGQDSAIMRTIITSIRAILVYMSHDCQDGIIDLAINYILNISPEQDIAQWGPSTIQPIAESIRAFLMKRFPFCKRIINHTVTNMLNMPPERGLTLGMQVSKAFFKALLEPITIQLDPIKAILMELVPNYGEIIDFTTFLNYEKVADSAIMYMLDITPPEAQASKALCDAIVQGDIAAMKAVIESPYGSMAANICSDVYSSERETPLHLAVILKKTEAIKLLLQQKVIIKKDAKGNTPIDLVISSKDNEMKKIFSMCGYIKKSF